MLSKVHSNVQCAVMYNVRYFDEATFRQHPHRLGRKVSCSAFFATAKPSTLDIYIGESQYLLKYLREYPAQDATHPCWVLLYVSKHHSGADRKGDPFSPEILPLCQHSQQESR